MSRKGMSVEQKLKIINGFNPERHNKKAYALANNISIVTFNNMLKSYEKNGEPGLTRYLNNDQAKIKELEKENAALKKIIAKNEMKEKIWKEIEAYVRKK